MYCGPNGHLMLDQLIETAAYTRVINIPRQSIRADLAVVGVVLETPVGSEQASGAVIESQ